MSSGGRTSLGVEDGESRTYMGLTAEEWLMAESIRQQIFSALIIRLQGILTTGGYESNLGSNIFAWKTDSFEASQLPGINVTDPTSGPEEGPVPIGKHGFQLNITLNVFVTEGNTTVDHARKMIADVYKALGVDNTFGGLAVRTELRGDRIEIIQQDKTVGGITIDFSIVYRTNKFNPYG